MRILLVVLISLLPLSGAFAPSNAKRPSSSSSTTRTTTILQVDGQGMAGGTRHLLGDIFRSLQPRYLAQVADALQSKYVKGMVVLNNVDAFCDNLEHEIESWEQLEKMLLGKVVDNDDKPSSARAATTTRLFGQKEPIVTLYRDSAAWCPYCQKVWIAFEEKQVPYEVIKVDMRCYGRAKPSDFLQLQPNGNLPCAVVNRNDGTREIVSDSNDIIDLLDGLGGKTNAPTLRPVGQEERIRELCDDGRESLERRLYARWMWWLTGVRRPQEYKDLFLEHWQEVEDALGVETSGPYFLGETISVVDLRFIPFVERQLASLAYFKGAEYLRDATRYPNLVRWLEAMESRPSYQGTKSDYYTHSRALPPQLSAECVAEAGCEDMQAAIDSWTVGDGDNDWKEPGWEWCSDPTREAAASLIRGQRNLAAFCARGAGVTGLPVASAPLADPAATANESAIPALDLLLRYITRSLLQKKSSSTLNEATIDLLDTTSASALADCLDYLRARIGVPRDLSYPAAQEIRKELLGVSRTLRNAPPSSICSPKNLVVAEML